MRQPPARKLWYLALPAIVTILLGLPSILRPFGFDQSNHAYIAWRCLQGEVLYTDIFSLKPPLTILLHALSQLIFGHHMSSIRLLDILWLMLETVLLAQLMRQLFPRQPAWVSIAGAYAYAQLYYTLSFWHSSQTDAWSSLPVTLALVASTHHWRTGSRGTKVFPLLAGICLATAIGFKYTLGATIVASVLAATLGPSASWRSRLSRSALVLGGVGIGMAATAVTLLAWGAWDGFIHNHLSAVLWYGGGGGGGSSSVGGPQWFALPLRIMARLGAVGPAINALEKAPAAWILSLAALALCPILLWRVRRDEGVAPGLLVVIVWWCCAWVSTAAQGRFFPYHFAPMLAPLGVLTAVAVHEVLSVLVRRPLQRRQRTLILATLCLCFSAASMNGQPVLYTSPGREYALFLEHAREGFDLDEYWSSSSFQMTRSFLIGDYISAARVLRQRAEPGDRLFTWGTSTAIYFLAELSPVTSVYTSVQVTEDLDKRVGRAQWLDELRADLPRFFAIQRGDAIPHVLPGFLGSARELVEFPELRRLLDHHYVVIGSGDRMRVLELKVPQHHRP